MNLKKNKAVKMQLVHELGTVIRWNNFTSAYGCERTYFMQSCAGKKWNKHLGRKQHLACYMKHALDFLISASAKH